MDSSRESTMVPSTDSSAAAEVTPAADSEASSSSHAAEATAAPRDSPTLTSIANKAPPPPPPTSHCLGARGYDGGFHDVGSFFVFQQEPAAKDGAGDADLELFGAAPIGKSSAPATPLQYDLQHGLRVEVAPPLGGAPVAEGQGSEVAGRVFEVLQRQV